MPAGGYAIAAYLGNNAEGVVTVIGWEFFIYRHDLVPDPRQIAPDEHALLARWVVGPNGVDWIENLVSDGKATDLSMTEYPCTYVAKASVVLAAIEAGPPSRHSPLVIGDDYLHTSGWSGDVVFHHERIEQCPPDLMLLIHAWDQS